MFIDRAEHDLSSLSHSMKQAPEEISEPMDATDTPAAYQPPATSPAAFQPPPVMPKPQPQQPAFQQQVVQSERMEMQQQVVSQQPPFSPQQPQFIPQAFQSPQKAPMAGAVQVMPMGPAFTKSPPSPMPKPAGGDSRPPTFLSQLQGAEINEGERY